MTVIVHAPFGLSHKESSLIYLFANYLKTINISVSQVSCNGAFSLCDKDEETGWKRTIDSCMNCLHNQKSLASWSDVASLDLSKFINTDEIILTRRVINEMQVSDFKKMKFGNISIFDLCIESIRLRIGNINPDFNNKRQEQLIRRFMLSAVRMCMAVKRIVNIKRPDMSLIVSGEDYITRAYLEQAKVLKSRAILFKMDLHERCIKIHNSTDSSVFTCPMMINDVTTMRADVNSWPKELTAMMYDIAEFLDVSDSQISLPLAQ